MSKTLRSGHVRGAFALLVALMPVAGSATSRINGVPQMEITREADQKRIPGPPQNFTGKVTISALFQWPEPSRVGGAIVHFEPGARTA